MDFIDGFINVGVTLWFGAFVVLIFDAVAPIFAIIASILASVFWVARIRKEVRNNYNNSIIEYIKSMFKS